MSDLPIEVPDNSIQVEVPDIVSLDDIMSYQSVLLQRENDTKILLTNSILNVSAFSLKPVLLQWATAGFPSSFVLIEVEINPPPVCSDGVSRSVSDYINFCLGDASHELYSALTPKLPGCLISYAIVGTKLIAYISKI
jgi:hypothetical protein